MLFLVKDMYGRECITALKVIVVSSEWEALQNRTPIEGALWVDAYPLTGGAVALQEGTFQTIREATAEDIRQCKRRMETGMQKSLDKWALDK